MAATVCTRAYTLLTILMTLLEIGYGIQCYQCNSISNEFPFQCNELLSSDVDLQPKSCDEVYGAQYCVKHTGRFEATTLDCYQCASQHEWKCMDGELLESSFVPANCSHVYGARYCVKSVGRYGGGIGTKRFCSAVDVGNYCDYVKQPGDKLTYRTCVFTCSSDGCNPATLLIPTANTWIIPTCLLIVWRRLFHR